MDRSAKRARPAKQQLGQFLTPAPLARRVCESALQSCPERVLEPSFGDGAFLLPIIEHFIARQPGQTEGEKLERVLNEHVWGVELDPRLYERALAEIERRWGPVPSTHNLIHGDYFRYEPGFERFDVILGNPPFGGTFDAEIEDALDKRFGRYQGDKVKKETYSFFIAKALGELGTGGILCFICSDTFLTIKTMKGLRRLMVDTGRCMVERLDAFSEETGQPMVVLTVEEGTAAHEATVFGRTVTRAAMALTGNFSWTIEDNHHFFFDGPVIGDYMVATGGMTIGKNELFLREIVDGWIEEPYDFEFFEDPITLARERERARLGQLSGRMEEKYREAEASGLTRRNVRVVARSDPTRLRLPHPDYAPYNKSSGARIYCEPSHVVYWKDDGDAVVTFKKNGPWYLHGVGGAPYFGREGLSWQLVAPRINARYLPPGYVLDSGAPCAFLRPGFADDELYFVLGWLQTELATRLLKSTINHTRNIQGKDIERLPYPRWVAPERKSQIVRAMRGAVEALRTGRTVDRAGLEHMLEGSFGVDEQTRMERAA